MIVLNGYKYSKCHNRGNLLVSNDNMIYAMSSGKYQGMHFLSEKNLIGQITDYTVKIFKGDLYQEVEKKVGMFKKVRRYVSLSGTELAPELYSSVIEFGNGLYWCNYGAIGTKEYDIQ